MHDITTKLLKQLYVFYPGGRTFNVQDGQFNNDLIQIDENHMLSVDDRVNPTMVVLTDENPDTGGQLDFWMIYDDTDLNDVLRKVRSILIPTLADLGYSDLQIAFIANQLGVIESAAVTTQVGTKSKNSTNRLV